MPSPGSGFKIKPFKDWKIGDTSTKKLSRKKSVRSFQYIIFLKYDCILENTYVSIQNKTARITMKHASTCQKIFSYLRALYIEIQNNPILELSTVVFSGLVLNAHRLNQTCKETCPLILSKCATFI